MPWGALITAGASYFGGQDQGDAAGDATALQGRMYGETVGRNQPFLESGYNALDILRSKLPQLTAGYDPQKLLTDPGYQFGLNEGQKTLESSLAARGLTDSGAALKAAARYGTDYSTGKLNDAFSRNMQSNNQTYNILQGLIGTGQASANNTSAAGQQFASSAGNNIIGAGDASAAGKIALGSAFGSLVNKGVSAYGNRSAGGSGGVGYDEGVGGLGAGGSPDGYWADGGPVIDQRRSFEPKVGTRAPVRGGGGGGMSREAVARALDEARGSTDISVPARTGMGALPANPVTNPKAITDKRLQDAENYRKGGEVDGPGGPRDDAIDAHLSDGEHVIDAATVTALGDGDNAAGQALLNELREKAKSYHAAKTRSMKKGARRG